MEEKQKLKELKIMDGEVRDYYGKEIEKKKIVGLRIVYSYRRSKGMDKEAYEEFRKNLEESARSVSANAYVMGEEMWFPVSDGYSYYASPVTFYNIE